jgi:ubiquinone/menaquinone biosynthesis C-methylase UbiE
MAEPSGPQHVGSSGCLTRAQARAFYDRFGSKQDSQGFYEDAAVQDLLAHAEFERANAAFEFGCGTGRFAETLFSRHLPAAARYVGRDVSATMVDLARQRLARFADRTDVRVTDGAPRIEAPDASFDRFVSNYVLDLLTAGDIAEIVSEARRVLTTEGRLCLVSLTHGSTPASRVVSWLWARIHRLRPQLVGGCRPLALLPFLSAQDWRILHHNVIVAYGIPSEIVVAERRRYTSAHI